MEPQIEQKMNKDARPFFARSAGQMGIYVDFYDVTPKDPQEYGSPQYMRMDFLDKLYEELSKIPLVKVKGAFERKNLFDGVIFEKWNKGVVITIEFDTVCALGDAWKSFEDGKVEPILKQLLNTPALLNAIGAKKIQLRARMWKDEYDACLLEMESMRLKSFTLANKENDQQMIRDVRNCQKNELEAMRSKLKEDYAHMDSTFSELVMMLRKSIPIKLREIKTFKEFEKYYNQLKSKKNADQLKPFEDYLFMRKRILEVIGFVEENMCDRLAQVHLQCETEKQHEVKRQMKTECAHTRDRLTEDFDWSHLKHPEWQSKILHREYKLFLGLVSVIGAGMDTIGELDIQCDEYFSGVDGIKL